MAIVCVVRLSKRLKLLSRIKLGFEIEVPFVTHALVRTAFDLGMPYPEVFTITMKFGFKRLAIVSPKGPNTELKILFIL